jgi:hypothetical protein
MIINNVILKEKSINVNEFLPVSKMHVNMHRNNIMPGSVNDNIFNCVIENEVSLVDENNKELVTIKIAYLIVVELKDEKYSQNLSEAIYAPLKSMYMKSINDLLRDSNYPPLPLKISC